MFCSKLLAQVDTTGVPTMLVDLQSFMTRAQFLVVLGLMLNGEKSEAHFSYPAHRGSPAQPASLANSSLSGSSKALMSQNCSLIISFPAGLSSICSTFVASLIILLSSSCLRVINCWFLVVPTIFPLTHLR